jgi:hypothetical protein
MKKLLLALAMFPMVAAANELTPGTFELSGTTTLGFSSASSDVKMDGASVIKTDTSAFALGGNGLYYLTPNFALGGRVSYLNRTTKDKLNNTEFTDKDFFFGPAAQIEAHVAPQVAVFGLLALGYESSSLDFGGFSSDGSGVGLNLEAGVKYFPVKSLSFDAALAYDYASLKYDTVGGVTPKQTLSGFGFNLGLSVYFGGGDGHH